MTARVSLPLAAAARRPDLQLHCYKLVTPISNSGVSTHQKWRLAGVSAETLPKHHMRSYEVPKMEFQVELVGRNTIFGEVACPISKCGVWRYHDCKVAHQTPHLGFRCFSSSVKFAHQTPHMEFRWCKCSCSFEAPFSESNLQEWRLA